MPDEAAIDGKGVEIMHYSPRDDEAARRIRHDRLQNTYAIIVDLYRHEDERYTDSLNIVTLIQTILFAGFIQLILASPDLLAHERTFWLLKILIPFLGIILSFIALYSFHRRIDAMAYWSRCARKVENDKDFWFTYDEKLDQDLSVFTTLHHWLEAKKTRYPKAIALIVRKQRYVLPVVFLLQWLLVLGLLLLESR